MNRRRCRHPEWIDGYHDGHVWDDSPTAWFHGIFPYGRGTDLYPIAVLEDDTGKVFYVRAEKIILVAEEANDG